MVISKVVAFASPSVQLPVPGSLAIKDLTLTYERISFLVEVKPIVHVLSCLSLCPSWVISSPDLFRSCV